MKSRRDVLSLIGRNATGLAAAATFGPAMACAQTAEPDIYKGHGMAMHGAPKYKEGFAQFDYVNPAASKGGSIYYGAAGATFDNLNPFILKGTPVPVIASFVFDTLTKGSLDEPFSRYGLIAKTMEVPKDRAWVAFEIDDRARFHDGTPLTADDVLYSFETLVSEKGHPRYRQYYHDVTKAEKTGPRGVKFTFRAAGNNELPLIMGELPVFSKAYYANRTFDQVTLDKPLGNGAYKIGEVSPGRSIVFERVKDYWAADLPVNCGYDNFDIVRVDYFRDATVAREAFKTGEYDYRFENQALAWATQYETEAVAKGELVKRAIPHQRPAGMQCFVMNTRRPLFKDGRVRRALTLMLDFEWSNKNLFYGQYTRSSSYFSNSEMAATGLPVGEELKVLEPFRGRVPDSVFKEPYTLPVYPGDGNIREGARQALALLKEAGWDFRGNDLVDKSGQAFRFEIITELPQFERIFLPYTRNLARLGIKADLRVIDPVQYQKRIEGFDFDMISAGWGQSELPGNEQRSFWSTTAADTPGSNNTIGIKDKAIDELIDLVINASDREALVTRCKALDRVLLHHHFVVPCWYLASDRLLWWDKFGVPAPHRRGTTPSIWWYDAAKAARLKGRIRSQPYRPDPHAPLPMFAYIIRRLLLIIPTVIGIMVINFVVINLAPGGPIDRFILEMKGSKAIGERSGGTEGSEVRTAPQPGQDLRAGRGLEKELRDRLAKQLGLDKPLLDRFLLMMRNYVTFDFGESFFKGRPVVDLVIERLPVSISLGLWATLLTYIICIPLGIMKAVRDGSRFDVWSSGAVIVAYAIPSFLFALLLIILFATGNFVKWFPLRGLWSDNFDDLSTLQQIGDYAWHIALPVIAMTIGGFATLTLLTKNSFLEEIRKQYVITARAKGLTERRVLYGHVFRNAMLIVIAGFPGAFISILFTGSLLIEVMFSLEGLGLLSFDAAIGRDYPILFASLYVFSLIGLLTRLISDLMYMLVDPRIDFEASTA